ncbi:DUF4190 domain-containing protein [Gordonia sp. NPDC003424]
MPRSGDAENRARPEPFLDDDIEPIISTSKSDTTSTDQPLAYSASRSDGDASDTPVTSRTRGDGAPAKRNAPAAATRAPATNRTAIWALVLSLLGITAPIGLFLGYRARSTISRTRELGESYARVAIWIGWLYVVVVVFVLVIYFWIAGQGS